MGLFLRFIVLLGGLNSAPNVIEYEQRMELLLIRQIGNYQVRNSTYENIVNLFGYMEVEFSVFEESTIKELKELNRNAKKMLSMSEEVLQDEVQMFIPNQLHGIWNPSDYESEVLRNLTGYTLGSISLVRDSEETQIVLEALRVSRKNGYTLPRFNIVHTFMIEILRAIHCNISKTEYMEINISRSEEILKDELFKLFKRTFDSLFESPEIKIFLEKLKILAVSENSKNVILRLIVGKLLKIVIYREFSSLGLIARSKGNKELSREHFTIL